MYDAIVLGLGGMGSSALAHIARRGSSVLGIEQFPEGHDRGSSSGRSRIIRKAYFEDPAYVPLLERAYELWRDAERRSRTTLLDLVGLLLVGTPSSAAITGAIESARRHDLALQMLERGDVLDRYPTLALHSNEVGAFEADAGIVFPERAIAAHLAIARDAGAHTRFSTRVTGYTSTPRCISVTLEDGSQIETARLAICAGPWFADVAADIGLPLRVQRNVQIWFDPTSKAYDAGRFPVFLADRDELPAPVYGFPNSGEGVKAALHSFGETTTANQLDRTIRAEDIACVARALDAFVPGAAANYRSGQACMYTLTPDEHFVIDHHPSDNRIAIAGGFSGHGFKFASVVGEIMADLTLDGGTNHPIGFLAINRFATSRNRQT